jgi:hypothetical protein
MSGLILTLAYTYYAFFEWGLVISDVAFDAASATELRQLHVTVSGRRRSC